MYEAVVINPTFLLDIGFHTTKGDNFIQEQFLIIEMKLVLFRVTSGALAAQKPLSYGAVESFKKRRQCVHVYHVYSVLAHEEASKPVLHLSIERRHLGELRQSEILVRSGRTECSIRRGCSNEVAGKQNDPAHCLI